MTSTEAGGVQVDEVVEFADDPVDDAVGIHLAHIAVGFAGHDVVQVRAVDKPAPLRKREGMLTTGTPTIVPRSSRTLTSRNSRWITECRSARCRAPPRSRRRRTFHQFPLATIME